MTAAISFRNRLWLALLFACLTSLPAFSQSKLDQEWQEFMGEIYAQNALGDDKTVADSRLKSDRDAVLKAYKKLRKKKDFDFGAFLREHFDVPEPVGSDFKSEADKGVQAHIERLWQVLERQQAESEGTLVGLPHPYIVPGGRFRELYYWDSYFTMLGLVRSGRQEMAKQMLDNFAYLIEQYGFVPNANRSYYLGRSQPPFFALMVELVAEHAEGVEMADYLPQLEKEYAFWMDGRDTLGLETVEYRRVVRMPQGEVLNRYWDDFGGPRPEAYTHDMGLVGQSELDSTTLFKNLRAACESGWDFSSRWMNYDATMANIHTTEIVPVDLNCLLYQLERTLAKAYAAKGKKAEAKAMNDASENRGLAIRKYFWFAEEGFFMDYAFWDQYHTGVHSLATVFPLVVKLASEAQAFSVAERLENEFLKEGGLVTTLNESGQQWDFPNGWAPLQWLAVKGLRNYDLNALADDVAYRWIQTVDQTFQRHGKILEKYNVIDPSLHPAGGEYPTQDGFGWTNGVYMGFMAP